MAGHLFSISVCCFLYKIELGRNLLLVDNLTQIKALFLRQIIGTLAGDFNLNVVRIVVGQTLDIEAFGRLVRGRADIIGVGILDIGSRRHYAPRNICALRTRADEPSDNGAFESGVTAAIDLLVGFIFGSTAFFELLRDSFPVNFIESVNVCLNETYENLVLRF